MSAPAFHPDVVPQFESFWTEGMGEYLAKGKAELGIDGIQAWIRANLTAICKSWGDEDKIDRVMWPIRDSGLALPPAFVAEIQDILAEKHPRDFAGY